MQRIRAVGEIDSLPFGGSFHNQLLLLLLLLLLISFYRRDAVLEGKCYAEC